MIERCGKLVSKDTPGTPVELRLERIEDSDYENASFVALNFTLQFVPAANRLQLLKKVSSAMMRGDALILSEKVRFEDEAVQTLFVDRYHAFKKANGYSDLEISQKRDALENVLLPDTIEDHLQRLIAADFSNANIWFQYFNFVSIIAVK